MRIISQFKDYYDPALFGVDPSLVYERKTVVRSIQETKGNTVEPKYPNIEWLYGLDKQCFIIGFCGKLNFFLNSITCDNITNNSRSIHELY